MRAGSVKTHEAASGFDESFLRGERREDLLQG